MKRMLVVLAVAVLGPLARAVTFEESARGVNFAAVRSAVDLKGPEAIRPVPVRDGLGDILPDILGGVMTELLAREVCKDEVRASNECLADYDCRIEAEMARIDCERGVRAMGRDFLDGFHDRREWRHHRRWGHRRGYDWDRRDHGHRRRW